MYKANKYFVGNPRKLLDNLLDRIWFRRKFEKRMDTQRNYQKFSRKRTKPSVSL